MRQRRNERGSAAVEYALLVAGIAAAFIVPIFAMQSLLTAIFQQTADQLSGGTTPPPSSVSTP